MKHKTTITPLNCAFDNGLNDILKMESTEYDTLSTRGIYCKSPDISWFKMKSVTATPFLEPVFYGIKKGDIIEVEFSALALKGSNVKINCDMLMVDSNYSASTVASIWTVADNIQTYYKRYKFKYIVTSSYFIGIIPNIKLMTNGSEVIIKDIEITLDTSNPEFSIANNITAYRSQTDYLKCIDLYSGTNLNKGYNGLLSFYNTSKITFSDGAMVFANTDLTNFKGLMTLLNGHKYRPSLVFYIEYISSFVLTTTAKQILEDGTLSQEATTGLPTATTLRKGIIYLHGSTTASRKTFMDIGTVGGGGDFTIKNVRFSMPQFDDSVKRLPNQLEELYTDLSSRLVK